MIITISAELYGLITHILVTLWGMLLAGGGMTEKEVTSLYCLTTFTLIFPTISACLHILAIAFRAITCFLVQRTRHHRNGRPYELRICDWHSVQDEEHILLDCPHEHLVSLRTQHRQLVFPPQNEDSPTRLRTILN